MIPLGPAEPSQPTPPTDQVQSGPAPDQPVFDTNPEFAEEIMAKHADWPSQEMQPTDTDAEVRDESVVTPFGETPEEPQGAVENDTPVEQPASEMTDNTEDSGVTATEAIPVVEETNAELQSDTDQDAPMAQNEGAVSAPEAGAGNPYAAFDNPSALSLHLFADANPDWKAVAERAAEMGSQEGAANLVVMALSKGLESAPAAVVADGSLLHASDSLAYSANAIGMAAGDVKTGARRTQLGAEDLEHAGRRVGMTSEDIGAQTRRLESLLGNLEATLSPQNLSRLEKIAEQFSPGKIARLEAIAQAMPTGQKINALGEAVSRMPNVQHLEAVAQNLAVTASRLQR